MSDRLGTPGYLCCFVASMTAAIMLPGWRAALGLALAAVLAALFYRAAFRALTHPGLWVFVGLLLVSMTFWVGAPDAHLGPIPVSLSGLAAGLQMSLRALAITLAVRGLASRETMDTARLRAGALWRRPRVLRLVAVTALTSAVRRAEDVAAAAEVRGFSPQRTRPLPLRRGRHDLALAVALAATVAALLLA